MAEYITVTSTTVEDAITKALIELGVTSDHLDYEVIDKGSKGFLGIGSRQATIRAKAMTDEEVEAKRIEKEAAKEAKESVKEEAPVQIDPGSENAMEQTTVNESAQKVKKTENDEVHFEEGKKFLESVFQQMNLTVAIEYHFNEQDNALEINLSGEEMGVLIGKRGQTLDSLQYLTGLVVNKSGEHYVRVKLDTENYRERRKETLESLAKNIAYKVKRTKRAVSLEPMNPYERRIIHSALQNDSMVLTKSEGEDPFRHVVVFLKKDKKYNTEEN